MPSAVSSGSGAVSRQANNSNDANYDEAVEDFWRDLPVTNQNDNSNVNETAVKDIDEEIKITKKRKPVAKLDETTLLSQAGIPELRRRAAKRMKFSGKGHEFSDISNLLNTYQLWLDDLYPRAKFRDGLMMVEKVGHTKRMQVMRRAWIEETKAGRRREDDDIERRIDEEMADGNEQSRESEQSDGQAEPERELANDRREATAEQTGGDAPEDDELDALLAEESTTMHGQSTAPATARRNLPFEEDDDEEDELDALLAESSRQEPGRNAEATAASAKVSKPAATNDDFADEEDILAGMGDDW